MKKYHFARLMNEEGGVSPLCASTPRAINLGRASWTIRREAVTCPKCLRRLREQPESADAATEEPE